MLALTVDHGLRPESAVEAANVAKLCAGIGVEHTTLTAPGLKGVRGNVQAKARAARYAAMEAECERTGVKLLMTAHHADDQAETLLMRLARGSGLSGLGGVRSSRPVGALRILRPLLGWRKSELAAIVSRAGLVPVDDPSNRSAAYDRTAARSLLTAAPWLDPVRVAASASHLADAEAALEWTVEQAWRGRAEWEDKAVLLDVEGLPRELVRRLVVRAVAALNPAASPDGPSVDRLIESAHRRRESTLGGIRISYGRKWRFAAAPPRRNGNCTSAHCS